MTQALREALEREQFEAHIRATWKVPADYLDWALKLQDGVYQDHRAADQWSGWEAARAALSAPTVEAGPLPLPPVSKCQPQLAYCAQPLPQAEPAPEGWVLVPKELTEEMHEAAVRTAVRCSGNDDFPPRVWRAMIAAAPQAGEGEMVCPTKFPRCNGMNCGSRDGRNHSLDCEAEHAAAIAGGKFMPAAAGITTTKPLPQAEPADGPDTRVMSESPWGRDDLMAWAAVRYCLGRSSYIVSDCASWLIQHWDEFTSNTRSEILRDIEEAFRRDAEGFHSLGMDCDRAEWERVRALWRNPAIENS